MKTTTFQKQKIIITVFYLLIPFIISAQNITVSGDITADTTWSADTVKVTEDITVQDDITLTIDPGTFVEFQGHYSLNIFGTLIATGTETDSITFTVKDTTGFSIPDSARGGWNRIVFNNSPYWVGADGAMDDNDTSRLAFCIIQYSKNIDSAAYWEHYPSGGAITVFGFSKLIISNSKISNNRSRQEGGGITCQSGADCIIKNNLIEYNISLERGGGIFCYYSNPLISGNTIIYNKSGEHVAWGGGIFCEGSEALIIDNNISYNETNNGAGLYLFHSRTAVVHNIISYNKATVNGWAGGIYCGYSNDKIINNTIANNTATDGAGISIDQADIEFVNNLVVNNSAENKGAGLILGNSQSLILNNTICNNHSSSEGGGMFCLDSKPLLMNNIIWGNTATSSGSQLFVADFYSQPDIFNCNIQGGTSEFGGYKYDGTYENNIDQDPLFIDPSDASGSGTDGVGANWSIKTNSLCVNAGNQSKPEISLPESDIAGKPRISHGQIDMGVYEVNVPAITVSGNISNDTTLIADTIKVDGDIIINDDHTLTITPGAIVEFQGNFKFDVRGTLMAIGLDSLPIIFTRNDTNGFSNPDTLLGCWKGIRFDNGTSGANGSMSDNDTSILKYCKIRFVKTKLTDDIDSKGSILLNYFSNILISHCTISNNYTFDGGGIYCWKSNPVITDNIIQNNKANWGGGISCGYSNPVIKNNLIINNRSEWDGGGLGCSNGKIHIENNIISGNSNIMGRGCGIALHACSGKVINNFISNNYGLWGGGMVCQAGFATGGHLYLINNIICNNSAKLGGGLLFFDITNARIINNTICYNSTGSNDGGGIVFGNSSPVFMNNLIWGNEDYRNDQILIRDKTSFPEFYFCNIQDSIDGIYTYHTDKYTGPFENNINANPQFHKPPEGAGSQYDIQIADFSVHPVSECINAGTSDTSGLNLPLKDMIGNQRINDNVVDIGAVENMDGLPEIILNPVNLIKCTGDSALFNVNTAKIAYYQWQKDGKDIQGATMKTYKLDSISETDDGNYQCIVRNAYGSVNSSAVYLIAKVAPEIILEPDNIWAIFGEKTSIKTEATGTLPIKYQWIKNGNILSGKTYPELLITNTTSDDEGEYLCTVSNSCGEVSTKIVNLYLAPQICMVTVDRVTGNNLVVWEKNSIAPISQYNIYRESKYAGIYDLLTIVPYDKLSLYNDTTADPTSRAYLYKITGVDTSGYETDKDLCKTHKTIHLLVTTNPETKATQLDWDHYVGFDYGTYEILRSDTTINFLSVDEMSSSTSTWSDPNPGTGTKYYRIAALRPQPCYPTGAAGKKAESGPYSHSMSNMEDNRLQTGLLEFPIHYENLIIHPNPFSGTTTLTFINPEGQPYTLFITDLSGKVCRIVNNISTSEYVLEKEDLKEGFYFVELRGVKVYKGKIVVE